MPFFNLSSKKQVGERLNLSLLTGALILFFAAVFQPVRAQPFTIVLRDKVDGNPVEFAQVVVVSGKTVTERHVTDSKGEAAINSSLPLTVQISCVGYKSFVDTIQSAGAFQISLSPDYYQLDQVVVTGQFRPQPVDKSIYSIRVIDQKQFQLKAATSLGDLVKNDLGFQYHNTGVFGDFIRIRGLSGEYIKILMDGMPVYGRVGDQIDLGQLSLNSIDHVEIIEGPMSVVYGSNALAGAINLISADHSGQKMFVEANGYYETVGTYNFNLGSSFNKGSHTFSLNLGRNFFSGWGPSESDRTQFWKPKLQYLADFGYRYQVNKMKITFNTDFMHEELRDLGTPVPDVNTISAVDAYHFSVRWNTRASFTNHFNDNFILSLQAANSYFKKTKITYLNDLVNLEKKIHPEADMHDTTVFPSWSFRGVVSNIPGKKLEYLSGVDVNLESADGKRTQGYQEMSDYSGFLNMIYRPVPQLSLQPGIRVMYNSKYNAPLIYSFNVKFNPGHFTARASYAKGFRAPSLKQLYLEFIDNNHHVYGNENLKAETSKSANLSLGYSFFHNRHSLNAQVDLFYNSINNAIKLAIDQTQPGHGMYFNVNGAYITQGVEATVSYRFSPFLELSTGMINCGRSLFADEKHFEYSTDWMATATFNVQKYGLQMAVFYKYTDDYLDFVGTYDENGQLNGVSQQFMSGYNTLDLTVTKNFIQEKLAIYTGVKNLFDVTLVNSFGSTDPHSPGSGEGVAGYGRTFFIGLKYRFSKF
jgi:outer membrane receptor for ferrienterochelin and colicins